VADPRATASVPVAANPAAALPSPNPHTIERLQAALGTDRVQTAVVLAPYTTFKIGGPADIFYEARTADELADVLTLAREIELNTFRLGTGANILIGDHGFRGLVVRNVAGRVEIDPEERLLWVESGAIVYPDVIEAAVSAGLSGLEHYVGIPSTVGGAMWQNLHFLSPPPERERTMFIEEVVLEAEILTVEGERRIVDRDYFRFGYDYSILHDRPDTVLSVTFQLSPAAEERMREVMEANLEWRAERHPPLDTEPSAGSIFKKIEGVGAGRLIDWAGLKGTRIGGAMVTERHANIMINTGGATAADVRALITHVQRTVERKEGYRLSPEIGFVGDFGDLPDVLPPGWENQDGFTGGLPPGGHPEKHRDAERR
jgi:UDP-N-acetylmuramate dehydrogenase